MSLTAQIRKAVKNRDVFQKIFCYLLCKLGYSDELLCHVELRNKYLKKLRKQYQDVLKSFSYDKVSIKDDKSNKVWVCWFQGMDNAPPIVKKCVQSISEQVGNENLTIITMDNIEDYVTLPKYIVEKWKKGIISNTHLSDILRLELLINHGGLWLDATTFITGEIPEYIYDNDLFMYRLSSNTHLSDILRLELLINHGGLWLDATTFITGEIPEYIYDNDLFMYRLSDANDKAIRYNTWLMYATPDNRVLKMVRDLLYEYWKRENRLKEYFLIHLFITMVLEKYPDDFDAMFRVSDSDSNILYLNYFNEPYCEETYNNIVKTTSIHKLTYKNLDEAKQGTFYQHIIEDNI